MKPTRKYFVTFLSPGTFFDEETEQPIASPDPRLAVTMAERIVERYGARPYGFVFRTKLIADPISDGEGGMLDVKPKTFSKTGTHYLGGTIETLDDVEARADPKEEILASNMRNDGWEIVVVSTNRYKSVHTFGPGDVVVDASGNITERGDDPKRIAYRAEVQLRL